MTQQSPLVIISGVAKRIASGDTLPPAALGTGTPDDTKFLRGDGAWVASGVGLSATTIKTTGYTAVANELVRVDATGGAFTVTLPASPTDGDRVGVFDIANGCTANPVLVAAAGGKTVEGTTGLSIRANGAYAVLLYNSATTNWKLENTVSNVVAPYADTFTLLSSYG